MDPTFKGLPTPLPTVQRKPGPNIVAIVSITGGFLLLIFVLGLLFGRGGGSVNEKQQLLYRLDATISLVDNAKKSLQNDDLQKINTELSLILKGDQPAVVAAIPKIKPTKELTALKTKEADAETTEKLKTAAVNGLHDTTYKEVLQQKLSELYTLSAKVNGETTSKSLKSATATLNEHATFYFNQIKELN